MAINNVCLEGFLYDDLGSKEVMKTTNGKDMLSFAFILANSNGANSNDKKVFVGCLAFGATATYLRNYGKKGSRIFIEGQVTGKFDKDGKNVGTSIMISSASLITKQVSDGQATQPKKEVVNDDDLPF